MIHKSGCGCAVFKCQAKSFWGFFAKLTEQTGCKIQLDSQSYATWRLGGQAMNNIFANVCNKLVILLPLKWLL